MYELKCKDIGGFYECDFVAVGETPVEAEEKLMEHGRAHHDEALGALSDEERGALAEKIQRRLKEQE